MDNIFDENTGGSSQVELSPEMEGQLAQLQRLAEMDPEFAQSTEYQELMEELNSVRKPGQSGAVGKTSDDHDEEDEEEEDEEEDDEDEDEDDEDDIFGLMKTQKKQKEVKLNFEPQKEMVDFIAQKYGINDAEKFFSSVETWRSQAQQGAEVQKEYDQLTNDLQQMPPELKMAVQAWANGEDPMSVLTMQQRLDFTGDFTNQDPVNLVQHYLPEEYEELEEAYENGDLDDEALADRINLLAKSTKRMFAEDKKALEKEREEFLNRQKNEYQMMKKSALLSVDNLSKAYPNFSKADLNKVRTILVEGKVDSMFRKSDGSYTDDAAELIAYAMYGKKMMEAAMKIAERKGESRANARIVDSSPTTVKKKSAAGANAGKGAMLDGVAHLSSMFTQDPYA